MQLLNCKRFKFHSVGYHFTHNVAFVYECWCNLRLKSIIGRVPVNLRAITG